MEELERTEENGWLREGVLTTHAFFNGTMWSMSRSDAAVQVAPSYGLFHEPVVAMQAESTVMLVASRFKTYSLSTQKLVDCA